jgi:iron complex transport system substrate-binding protein
MNTTRALVAVLTAAFIAVVACWSLNNAGARGASSSTSIEWPRIVSLAPAVTETLFAIGAGDRVVGVSDHCSYPSEATARERAGSWLSPNYEALARLEPTLILTSAEVAGPIKPLLRIAPTERLEWLTFDDMLGSILRIGTLTGQSDRAKALASKLKTEMARPLAADAPRVLLTLEHQPGRLSEVWFLRDASIHGTVLRAAGGRNAVAEPLSGPPRLSLQRVLELDPEIVIVLSRAPHAAEYIARKYVEDWKALEPLRAASAGRIGVVQGPDVHVTGPRILALVEQLRSEIVRLKELR